MVEIQAAIGGARRQVLHLAHEQAGAALHAVDIGLDEIGRGDAIDIDKDEPLMWLVLGGDFEYVWPV